MKRKILEAALFQHSSKMQPFKQFALDTIVERVIFYEDGNGIKLDHISSTIKENIGYLFPLEVIQQTIDRLDLNKIIEYDRASNSCKLKYESKERLLQEDDNIRRRNQSIINRLFRNAKPSANYYSESFWFCLNTIFSKIGEQSASIINGTVQKENLVNPLIQEVVTECQQIIRVDETVLKSALNDFFENITDPNYNEVKCILSQNYFIFKTIGINPSSEMFSSLLFENVTFYLDTNIILSAISKHNQFHLSTINCLKAISKLNVNVVITCLTEEEYITWLDKERSRILATSRQIPKETRKKVSSFIYQDCIDYIDEEEIKGRVIDIQEALGKIIETYSNYKDLLNIYLGSNSITIDNDIDKGYLETCDEYKELKKQVKKQYVDLLGREKNEHAILHDSFLLMHLYDNFKKHGLDSIVLTTDTSLPLIKMAEREIPNNIHIDSMLQWLLPLTGNVLTGDDVSNIADIFKNKLLPKSFLFEIKDFVIFEQLSMECQGLPSGDVEACILYLKKNVPGLNPNRANDREKMSLEIARFFVDPTKKYATELNGLTVENSELRSKLGIVSSKLEEIILELKTNVVEYESKIANLNDSYLENDINNKKSISILTSQVENLQLIISTDNDIKLKKEGRIKYYKWKSYGYLMLFLFLFILYILIALFIPEIRIELINSVDNYLLSLNEKQNHLYQILLIITTIFFSVIEYFILKPVLSRIFSKTDIKNKKTELGLF